MNRVALTDLLIFWMHRGPDPLPAHELPGPLDQRVQVTEDTGAKMLDYFVARLFKAICLSSCRIDLRSLTPGQLYELNQV